MNSKARFINFPPGTNTFQKKKNILSVVKVGEKSIDMKKMVSWHDQICGTV